MFTVLFDLDSTLLEIPGDRAVRARALAIASGSGGLLDVIDDRGRTDCWLIHTVATQYELVEVDLWQRYEAAYPALLCEALERCRNPVCRARLRCSTRCAARQRRLESRPGTFVATIAKLRHAGLARAFVPLRGGFGDDHGDRADVVRAAMSCPDGVGAVVLVGDTVHDVRAALDVGVSIVAVATGHASWRCAAQRRRASRVAQSRRNRACGPRVDRCSADQTCVTSTKTLSNQTGQQRGGSAGELRKRTRHGCMHPDNRPILALRSTWRRRCPTLPLSAIRRRMPC